jgi:hypothetical protein
MRYIYYIVAVLVIAAVLIIFQFVQGKPAVEKKPAIIVNEKVITADEFAKIKPPHDELNSEFINSLVIKELLIQEAQRTGIDKEETFRRSIQNFYEQSLVKVLMDRKFAALKIAVSDEEVDRYYALLDKKLSLTIYTAATAADLNAGKARDEKRTISFGDLSRKMRSAIVSLKKGEKSAPVQSGNEYILLQLDGIKPGSVRQADVKKEDIRKLITDEKKEEIINEWLEGMRSKAKIKILVSGINGGK